MGASTERIELRNFGLLVGGIFGIIGLWPWLMQHGGLRLWALIPAAVLMPAGLLAPTVLRPFHKAWMAAGHVLGWINTRIILGVVYYVVVVPMGIGLKLLRRDPMRRSFSPGLDTYRVVRTPRPPEHMKNMF